MRNAKTSAAHDAAADVRAAQQALEGHSELPLRRAREVFSAGNTYVHERPWRLAGVAGLLGIVAGFFFTRR